MRKKKQNRGCGSAETEKWTGTSFCRVFRKNKGEIKAWGIHFSNIPGGDDTR